MDGLAAWRSGVSWTSGSCPRAPFASSHHKASCDPCEYMNDGCPFLVPTKRAILCLVHKGGSTTWKLALLRAQKQARRYHRLQRSPHSRPPSGNTALDFTAAAQNRSVPRLMMVRNPYSRILSAYLDKVVLQQTRKLWPSSLKYGTVPSKNRTVPSFRDFVQAVTAHSEILDRHFQPLSNLCLIDDGTGALSHRYDFFLKVEQMERWYLPFVRLLGIEPTLRTGWNLTTHWWKAREGRDCFYTPLHVSCADFHGGAREVARTSKGMSEDASKGAATPASFHATQADGKLGRYYDVELAAAVTQHAAADFKTFGYPVWDGLDARAYMLRLRQER